MVNHATAAPASGVVVRRFDRFDRVLHGLLMLSFLGLAFTGLPLLFSAHEWASFLSRLFGGFHIAGLLHRFFALLMIVVFGLHLAKLARRLFVKKEYFILWGPRSLVPQPRDIKDLLQHFRYFVGLGPRPRFEHFTYWEKFDYWAVFWGMGIIGGSGLMLWFPKLFSRVLPGWAFNIGLLIHGEEALLAVVFIFTTHFFNGHLRPEKFPMDTVIFTGRIPLEEIRHERAGEFDRLTAEEIEGLKMPAASPQLLRASRVIGTVAVLLGLTMVVLTIYAFVS